MNNKKLYKMLHKIRYKLQNHKYEGLIEEINCYFEQKDKLALKERIKKEGVAKVLAEEL